MNEVPFTFSIRKKMVILTSTYIIALTLLLFGQNTSTMSIIYRLCVIYGCVCLIYQDWSLLQTKRGKIWGPPACGNRLVSPTGHDGFVPSQDHRGLYLSKMTYQNRSASVSHQKPAKIHSV